MKRIASTSPSLRLGSVQATGLRTRLSTRMAIAALLLLATVALFTAALLAACAPQEVEKPPDEVSVQLKWVHQAQFAGFYAADQNGYYADEGLAVTILAGGPGIDHLASVLDGAAQFGVAGADRLIVERANGKPLRAIATIYRRNPRVFVARADSGISRPEDFVGQKIYEPAGGMPTLHAMMTRVGIGPDQYTVVSDPYDLALFASGEVPVWGAYLTGSIRNFQEAGYELSIIYPGDYGVHFYADTIFAIEDFIAANPELAVRFLRATLRGWRWAIENSEGAGSLALKYDPELDEAVQLAQMEASVPLIHTGEDHIGWMRAEVWEGMHDILLEQGLLDGPVDVDKVYTMEFLQKVYKVYKEE